MYLLLTDRGDRLGSNLANYIGRILLCHKNKFIIKYKNDSKEKQSFYDSVFVKILFNYIDKQNKELYEMNRNDKKEFELEEHFVHDIIAVTTFTLKYIKTDFFTYFHNNIYKHVIDDFRNLTSHYSIPFDVNNTILVHLRLGDVTWRPDYDGSECSEFFKKKIENNLECNVKDIPYERVNNQAPLSKWKVDNIINKAKEEFKNYKVILLTSPDSDTHYYPYEVIKNDDENLDLYLLTMSKVSILSRSSFAYASLYFNKDKIKTYIPLWGHAVCHGLDTIYDKLDKSKIEYFY